jgi:hypothetical protein
MVQLKRLLWTSNNIIEPASKFYNSMTQQMGINTELLTQYLNCGRVGVQKHQPATMKKGCNVYQPKLCIELLYLQVL